jgi:hypothetical protein
MVRHRPRVRVVVAVSAFMVDVRRWSGGRGGAERDGMGAGQGVGSGWGLAARDRVALGDLRPDGPAPGRDRRAAVAVAVGFWRMLGAGGDNVSSAGTDDATDTVERGS